MGRKNGTTNRADRTDEHHWRQVERAEPGTGRSEQLGIAQSKAIDAPERTTEPSDRPERIKAESRS